MEPVAMAIHGINILLLLGLLYIYGQNAKQMKSKVTYGLVLFALFLLAQSFMDLYYQMAMVMYSSTAAETAATILGGVKLIAFTVLLWVSWE